MTSTDTIDARILDLAARRFGKARAELTNDQDFFRTLGIDSYQALELLTELEEAFGVEIPDFELNGVTTFAGLAEVIRRRT